MKNFDVPYRIFVGFCLGLQFVVFMNISDYDRFVEMLNSRLGILKFFAPNS